MIQPAKQMRQTFSNALRRMISSAAISESKHKVIVVGGGSAGLSVAHQVINKYREAGKRLKESDVVILDAAQWHHYQPGWTLVGAGLKPKTAFRQPLATLDGSSPVLRIIPQNVASFNPQKNSVVTSNGSVFKYDAIIVAPGLHTNWKAIPGLSDALLNPNSGVSSIYSYESCDKVWSDINALRNGDAIFTQPAGVIKCAGAPQKIMWMARSHWLRTQRLKNIRTDFYTGMPTMFSVPKYSKALNELRLERNVGGYFEHNLVSIDSVNHKATFKKPDNSTVVVPYTLLHVTPPMGPLDVVRHSELADPATGWVDVDQETLQHRKYMNVFSLGDASSLPTSKTAAAITAQAPVLTENLFSLLENGQISSKARYDGYTSCPLLTGHNELMLAEFKYGLEPKETFGTIIDQSKPKRFFYYLKTEIFPWAYWTRMVKGTWFGRSSIYKPSF